MTGWLCNHSCDEGTSPGSRNVSRMLFCPKEPPATPPTTPPTAVDLASLPASTTLAADDDILFTQPVSWRTIDQAKWSRGGEELKVHCVTSGEGRWRKRHGNVVLLVPFEYHLLRWRN